MAIEAVGVIILGKTNKLANLCEGHNTFAGL